MNDDVFGSELCLVWCTTNYTDQYRLREIKRRNRVGKKMCTSLERGGVVLAIVAIILASTVSHDLIFGSIAGLVVLLLTLITVVIYRIVWIPRKWNRLVYFGRAYKRILGVNRSLVRKDYTKEFDLLSLSVRDLRNFYEKALIENLSKILAIEKIDRTNRTVSHMRQSASHLHQVVREFGLLEMDWEIYWKKASDKN